MEWWSDGVVDGGLKAPMLNGRGQNGPGLAWEEGEGVFKAQFSRHVRLYAFAARYVTPNSELFYG